MDSTTLYTEEIDDLEESAADLFAQAESFAFKKNTLAIIFMEEETDYEGLYALLKERWKFPVMGCTGMASFTGKEGYCDMGISVMLLTADDCVFSVGMTGELDIANYKARLAAKYKELNAALPEKEKLIISFGGMVTSEETVGGDDLVDTISSLSGGVPVYGGTAADGFTSKNIKVCCNGSVTKNGQVMALVSGNINPRFVYVNSIENKSSFSYQVTEARGNQVFRLGLGSFVETLERENMESEKTDVLGDYILSPFILTVTKDTGDSLEVARSLSVLNRQNGSGSFLGAVPEGSVLGIGVISRADVQKAVGLALEGMRKKLEDGGGECKTILCVTCCARFLALAGNKTAEADALKERLPPSFSLMGMYSYGEYCPVTGNVTGKNYNMFHNFTFTMMAF